MVAHAAPDPWAVVVHPEYALAANRAVVRPWRLQSVASLAVPVHEDVLQVHPPRRKTIAPLDSCRHMLPANFDSFLLLSQRILLHKLMLVIGLAVLNALDLDVATGLADFTHFNLLGIFIRILSRFLNVRAAVAAPCRRAEAPAVTQVGVRPRRGH